MPDFSAEAQTGFYENVIDLVGKGTELFGELVVSIGLVRGVDIYRLNTIATVAVTVAWCRMGNCSG
ncbi:hypothetical protein [Amycolatopsis jejuensis]|uniref:hypothetical protein n=1 Tax=Amycolatopsis jejuensis TaxID=330084 RepID=UPI000AE9B502|nr:hypothetical protein [Amycolatopsis jejuensis]